MIDILVVEDDLLFREVLTDILQENFNAIAFVSTEEVVKHVMKYIPKVILMDIQLEDALGINAFKKIEQFKKESNVDIKIIIFSVFFKKEHIDIALDLNVDGYILKENIKDKLIITIKSCNVGLVSLDNKIIKTKQSFNNYNIENIESIDKKFKTLTSREKEVVSYIAKGNKNIEIAKKLNISKGRVKNIITAINQKIETENSKEIAVFGYKVKSIYF